MKKRFAICCITIVLILYGVLCVGCFDEGKFEASFVRFGIGKRQTDYYLDFTVKLDNKTNSTETVTSSDFCVEVNGNKIDSLTFLYESSDTFYPVFVSVESGSTLTLRVRAIAVVNNKQQNKILLKYKDKTLVEDNVYVSDNN
ncbi:MAG: hypothetical protein NC132_03900 [Corallococcus sp.]|nr:hypothetical protein [Corallococcus sp.]MCM1359802.1 hypothetical protein [Corallococcus sp.]MCM1395236.1 hypothetical protein [Corallococcus sp.]